MSGGKNKEGERVRARESGLHYTHRRGMEERKKEAAFLMRKLPETRKGRRRRRRRKHVKEDENKEFSFLRHFLLAYKGEVRYATYGMLVRTYVPVKAYLDYVT